MKDLTTDNESNESNAKTVTILAADPSPTPTKALTATPVQSPTPTSLLDPEPTEDPALVDLGSPLNPSPASAEDGTVQGLSTEVTPSPNPTLIKKTNSIGFLPFIFIGLGGVLLCVPFVIAKIKK